MEVAVIVALVVDNCLFDFVGVLVLSPVLFGGERRLRGGEIVEFSSCDWGLKPLRCLLIVSDWVAIVCIMR